MMKERIERSMRPAPSESSIYSIGFTAIPHEIMEAIIRSDLSSCETRTLLFIARQTWGWQKESDTIALRQFGNATGIDRRNIYRTLCKLETRRMVVIRRDDRKASTYRINKNLSQWYLSSVKTTASKKRAKCPSVIRGDDSLSSPETTAVSSVVMTDLSSPETPSKETKKKERKFKETPIVPSASAQGAELSLGPSKNSFSDSDEAKRLRMRLDKVREQKELSAFRNLVFKSGLYESGELGDLKAMNLSQLQTTHVGRVVALIAVLYVRSSAKQSGSIG